MATIVSARDHTLTCRGDEWNGRITPPSQLGRLLAATEPYGGRRFVASSTTDSVIARRDRPR
jgi:hypothetical protein